MYFLFAPAIGVGPFGAAVLALGLFEGAYMAEPVSYTHLGDTSARLFDTTEIHARRAALYALGEAVPRDGGE